jgi:hypothetical protein
MWGHPGGASGERVIFGVGNSTMDGDCVAVGRETRWVPGGNEWMAQSKVRGRDGNRKIQILVGARD